MYKKIFYIFSISLWILVLLLLFDLFILILPSAVELVVRGNLFPLILMIGAIWSFVFITRNILKHPLYLVGGLLFSLLVASFGITAINDADGHCTTFKNPIVLSATKLNVKIFPKLFPTLKRRLEGDYLTRCQQ